MKARIWVCVFLMCHLLVLTSQAPLLDEAHNESSCFYCISQGSDMCPYAQQERRLSSQNQSLRQVGQSRGGNVVPPSELNPGPIRTGSFAPSSQYYGQTVPSSQLYPGQQRTSSIYSSPYSQQPISSNTVNQPNYYDQYSSATSSSVAGRQNKRRRDDGVPSMVKAPIKSRQTQPNPTIQNDQLPPKSTPAPLISHNPFARQKTLLTLDEQRAIAEKVLQPQSKSHILINSPGNKRSACIGCRAKRVMSGKTNNYTGASRIVKICNECEGHPYLCDKCFGDIHFLVDLH